MTSDVVAAETVREILCDLVRIPSVNPSIAPAEGTGEAAIAAYTRDRLTAAGVHAWQDEAAPGRPNVVGEIGSGSPTLVLCAHLDTVGTTGMSIPPFEPTVADGRVYGRGSYDMKGSAAAIMAAAASLANARARGHVLLALVADEEYASIGALDFVRRYPADGCIVTEPAEGKLVLGHKGFVWAKVTTAGRAAHGSRWDLGVSAIGKMAHIITALEEFDRIQLRQRVDPLVGPASLHCALISGGVGLSTYAPGCELQIERRTIPGETAAQVQLELHTIVRRVDADAVVECFFDRPPLASDAESLLARVVRDAITAVSGHRPEEGGVQFWMDAAIFAQAGIPTVNYGPTGAGAHEAVEWVDLDSVVTCANVLREAANRFCSAA